MRLKNGFEFFFHKFIYSQKSAQIHNIRNLSIQLKRIMGDLESEPCRFVGTILIYLVITTGTVYIRTIRILGRWNLSILRVE